jgi:hypothetical protein
VFVMTGSVGRSRETDPGELSSSSGFAIRKPPKDCERLRSFSIMESQRPAEMIAFGALIGGAPGVSRDGSGSDGGEEKRQSCGR